MTSDPQKLVQEIIGFRQERDWDKFHSPKNLSMALLVEAAELMEHFQWLTAEESSNLPPNKLADVEDEIGDVVIYLWNLAEKLAIDPLEAAHAKIKKNRLKYPVEKVRGKAGKS